MKRLSAVRRLLQSLDRMTVPKRLAFPYGYIAAALVTLLVALFRHHTFSLFHPHAPWLPLVTAVLISAWVGGAGPGLLSTFLSLVIGRFLLYSPSNIAPIDEAVHIAIFLALGVAISFMTDRFFVALQGMERLTEALRERDERLREVVRHAPCILWEADIRLVPETPSGFEWRQHLLDEQAAQAVLPLDTSAHGSYSKAWAASVHPEDRKRLDAFGAEILTPGDHLYEQEFRCADRNGAARWIHERIALRERQPGRWSAFGVSTDITKSKKAEEVLRRYELLTRHSRDSILLIRKSDGRILEANDAAVQAYGYTREELLSLSIHDLRDSSVAQQTERLMDEAFDRGIQFETIHRRKNGAAFTVEVSSRGANIAGTPMLVSAIRDITERKRTEDALRRTTERYALLSETAGALLASPNPQAEMEILCRKVMEQLECELFFNFLVNEAEQRLHLNACAGIPAEEAERIEWLDYGVAVCGCVARDRRRIIAERIQQTPDARTDLIRSYGVQAYCCHPLMAGDRLIGTLSFGSRSRSRFAEDEIDLMRAVTDLVAVAMERVRIEQALRESELFYRQTLESIPGMVFTTRPDGYCDYQSQQWVDYTGVPVVEHLGDGWIRLLHPEDHGRARDAWRAAIAGRAPYDLEYRVRRRDGRYEWFKVIGQPIRDASGRIVRWFGVAANIDEMKRTEEALRTAKIIAEEASKAKDEFLAMLAHELRNPLAPVMNAIHLLNTPGATSDIRARAVETMNRQTRHLAHLVDDLLDVSRIARGKTELKREPLDLNDLARTVRRDWAGPIAERGIELRFEPAGAPLPILADEARITQALGNLLHNASKFTEPGGWVALRASGGNGTAEVTVSDNGIGIETDQLDRIFEAFAQADPTLDRSRGGLGLGLPLVKGVVELHEGRVAVDSAGKGQGTTFTLSFPLLPADALAGPPADASGSPPAESPAPDPLSPDAPPSGSVPPGSRVSSGARRRVLVIEDHDDTADLLCLILHGYGHTTFRAADGGEGVALALEHRPDVILCDVGLPVMDGYEVARTLRGKPEMAETTLIALTGYGSPEDRRKTRQAGFDDHLTKPVDPETLMERMERSARSAPLLAGDRS